MLKSKMIKAFLVTMSLSLLLIHPAYAATYTVASGDSLYRIGNLFNTTGSVIMKSNNITSSVIYPGQVLNVPCSTYAVKSGDSLYLIAKRYGLSLYSLRKANNKWGNLIYPGQILNLPGIDSDSSQASTGSGPSRGADSRSIIPYSTGDMDLLSRLITAEADGQPYAAQVGVGAVVVNRVKDTQFPDTISAVIYQKSDGFYQFTPVENEWINKPASQDAKNAAYDALYGSDPTRGALFYFDDSATNKWLWSKPIAARIGRMVFVY